MLYAIVDTVSGKVIDAVEFDPALGGVPRVPVGCIALGTPTINPGDTWDGQQIVSGPPPKKTVHVAELVMLLSAKGVITAGDIIGIQT
jgi:hypothetical protein